MTADARAHRKELGAFYTAEPVVDFLVRWGMSQVRGSVMDPSCGDGRFLLTAARLGAHHVIGCDLDASALTQAAANLRKFPVPHTFIDRDFFALRPDEIEKVDLIVGNPPFIRYQRFSGDSRRNALESALRLGVRLSALTSAWAPFLLHAVQFLRAGGALGVVVPAELVQTNYGIPTLRALCGRFSRVRLIAFARNFFPAAQAETYLLLAEQAGKSCQCVELHALNTIDDLEHLTFQRPATANVDIAGPNRIPFAEAFLSPREREAWHAVMNHPSVITIAQCGQVTNGYVSGDNGFFHGLRDKSISEGIPGEWLRPTVRSAHSLRGLRFTGQDVADLEVAGHPHHLIDAPDSDLLNPHRAELSRWLRRGEALGIHRRFKCRTRQPWWRVPGTHVPDIILPYMVGRAPITSVNMAGATYTNTLHGLRLRQDCSPEALAVALHSTLALLSMELEGRSYGGGVLKLEPSEVQRVRLCVLDRDQALADEVDSLLRRRNYAAAVDAADHAVLHHCLGLGTRTIELLRNARERLVARRYTRTNRRSG